MVSSTTLNEIAPNFVSVDRYDNIFVITLQRAQENRLTVEFCRQIIQAFDHVRAQLAPGSPGAVITRGSNTKFWCTGVDLDERLSNPSANSDGFYPMLHTILDFPFPTIALLTGHTFGGACPFALAHDYRIMNSERGFFCMPPVDLGLHFNGTGTLLRLKLAPQIARKMLLEGHKWTSSEAFNDRIVDAISHPDEMFDSALALAQKLSAKAEAGVYGLLRGELYGEADLGFQRISYVHSKPTSREPNSKI